MTVPLAVDPATKQPALYLTIDLKAGITSPGTSALRCLLIANKATSGGTAVIETVYSGLSGPDQVATLLKEGTPGHLAAVALFTAYPRALVDLVVPDAPAGVAATATVTFDDTTPIAAAQTVRLRVAGRVVEIAWLVGETDIQAATKLVTAIGKLGKKLPVTAANGGGALAVVTLTFKQKGTIGNDCLLSVEVSEGSGGDVQISGNMGSTVAGTTEANLTNVLDLVKGVEYAFYLPCLSNTDAAQASTTSNPGRIKTHFKAINHGASAKLQQAVFAVTSSLTAAKAGAAQHDFEPFQYVLANAAQSLPCEWAAAEVGERMREEAIDPVVNRCNSTYAAELFGALDPVGDALTDAQIEDALNNGVSPVTYTSSFEPRMSRPITSYFKDDSGNADDRVLDVGGVSGIYAVGRDIRVALPQAFPKAKLSRNLEPGDDELPEGVVEERDVVEFIYSRLRFWVSRGVIQGPALAAALADGTLLARVNPSDETQCDVVIPAKVVRILAKFGVVLQKV